MDYGTEDVRMRGPNDDDDEDDDEDDDLDVEKVMEKSRKHLDDDDDDDDEEEEEDTRAGSSRKTKRRRKDAVANPYIDLVATVDDDDDDDEDDEEAEAGFLQYQQQEDEEDEGHPESAAAHARLDRQRLNEAELSNEEMARILKERYSRNDRIVEDMGQVPQRMLMPSVNDPNLWQIKVKPGRERDIVLSLYRKTLDLEFKANPLDVISAFERTSIPGYVYVESRSKAAVIQACANLIGIYRRDPILVPINEMAPLLQLKKKETPILPGAWVRLKRGKYQGDLAQVVDITDNGEEAGIRFLPRIDMNPKEGDIGPDGKQKRKRPAGASGIIGRPPARPFNPEEVLRIYGKKSAVKRGPSWIFQGDTYTNGFIEKDVRVNALTIENVNPALDEVSMFLINGKDGADGVAGGGAMGTAANLEALADAVRRPVAVSLQPGDHVEVFQGEQSGARGTVDSVMGDVVLIRGEGLVGLEGQMMEVPSRHVRKRFAPGEHVKVMSGLKVDETGMVVDVKGELVTFVSDLTEEEVTVFSKDLRTAAEVGSSSNVVGNYELHDLVQLDMQTVGVIYRTERDSFRVLDQAGQTRLVQPHQITMRRDSRRAISTDAEGNELRVGDNVKEVDGEGRRGVVLHIHQATFAFLHNREIPQDGGIFVTRCRSLAPIAPKGAPKPGGIDLTKMNPAVAGGQGGAPSMSRGPRDRLIGVNIKIIKGPQKGYAGVIKDVNGPHCRVELSTNNRIISIEKEKLRRVGQTGQLEPLEGAGGFAHPGQNRGSSSTPNSSWGTSNGGRTPNPYNVDGGRTPGWGTTGRTPNPYANNRTPAWTASTQTPNPYADSSKTPSWNANSRTPNPYANDGGKTPGWNPSSRTPNPYAAGAGAGGKTPSWEAGSRTPNPSKSGWGPPTATSSNNTGWGTPADDNASRRNGAETPAGAGGWGPSANDSRRKTVGWGDDIDDSGWGAAPTPAASAATPYASAPTPYMAAPTPAASAPTPAPYAAETPAPFGAPTPAYSAPTPGGPGYTPSGYAAPTPRGVAQTPAAIQDYTRTARDAPFSLENVNWLLEFNIPNICAEFREESSFMGGVFSSRPVVVRTVNETREGLTSTADIELLDEDHAEISGVAIDHFQPLCPISNRHQGEQAVLLQNHLVRGRVRMEVAGAKKEIVVLRTFQDQEWLCGRVNVPGAADIEVQATALCLMHSP